MICKQTITGGMQQTIMLHEQTINGGWKQTINGGMHHAT